MTQTSVGRSLGIFLIIAGIGHFIFPKGLDAIVPEILPGDPRLWTYLSGLAEIAIGIALLTTHRKTRRYPNPLNRRLRSARTFHCGLSRQHKDGGRLELPPYARSDLGLRPTSSAIWTLLLGLVDYQSNQKVTLSIYQFPLGSP